MNVWRLSVLILFLALGACEGGGGPSGGDVVATAGGAEFTAEAAAEILAPQSQLPAQPQVVQALADLWVQYYLLARASVEDTTLSHLDVEPLVERQLNGELLAQLRESVVQVDTALTEDELRARYEETLPGGSIRARHILLRFPENATDAQADSVRTLASELRGQLLEGADFEALARQYSQDESTADRGGDLGSFGKGEMVPAFEAEAFDLDVGEISQVVETAFGLHLIRVDERTVPPFEERENQFRAQVQTRLVMEAESTYVANLAERAEIQIDQEALESVRRLASDSNLPLSNRALQRPLVRYDGGSLTLGEFRTWLLTNPQNAPQQIAAATDEQLENLLNGLTRSELLVNEALAEGFEVSAARTDSVTQGLIDGVREIARELGFFDLQVAEGETPEEAAQRTVQEILRQIVQEGRNVYPLQTIAFALKEQYGARIFPAGLEKAAARVNEIRSAGTAPAPGQQPGSPEDTASSGGAEADTASSEVSDPEASGVGG